MYSDFLQKFGLSKEQAQVYDTLLQGGYISARKISLGTGLKRGLVYKVLDQLIELGLAEKNEKLGKIALFFPTHPSKLKDLFEKRTAELKTAENAFQSVLGQMTSAFNLVSGKPNVQFFEGENGLIETALDSLTSQTEIYQYIDNEAVATNIPEFNKEYTKKRQTNQIKKKMLCIDSKYIRERVKNFDPQTTEVRLVSSAPFSTVMQIYDNKISYITLNKDRMIGVIIESPEIYAMHKTIFENAWEKAEQIEVGQPTS